MYTYKLNATWNGESFFHHYEFHVYDFAAIFVNREFLIVLNR